MFQNSPGRSPLVTQGSGKKGRRAAAGMGGRTAALIGLLAALWLLLSGYWDAPLLLAFGAASVAFCVLAARHLGIFDAEGHPYYLTWRGLGYWPWLVKEICKSNVDVARRVLRPRLDLYPVLFPTRASQEDDLGQVIYANSITLTPGTVSIDLEPHSILVHAITREGEQDVKSGEMDRRVSAMVDG